MRRDARAQILDAANRCRAQADAARSDLAM
jgi:hypothetical protein